MTPTENSCEPVLTGFGLGSNIDADRNIAIAVAALETLLPDLLVSPVYRCKAVGFDGDPFLNLVVAAKSSIPLERLQREVKALESASGRTGAETKYSGRTLDIDILFHGQLICDKPDLRLPRRDVVKYAYVLKPLTDILPQWVHPETGQSAAALWDALINAAGGEEALMRLDGVQRYQPSGTESA